MPLEWSIAQVPSFVVGIMTQARPDTAPPAAEITGTVHTQIRPGGWAPIRRAPLDRQRTEVQSGEETPGPLRQTAAAYRPVGSGRDIRYLVLAVPLTSLACQDGHSLNRDTHSPHSHGSLPHVLNFTRPKCIPARWTRYVGPVTSTARSHRRDTIPGRRTSPIRLHRGA